MRFWLPALPWRSFCIRTFTAALAIALLLAMLCQSQAADPKPKLVLMLHSFGLRFKPWTDYAVAIRSEISRKSKTPVDYHDHSLLNARLGADKSDDSFVDYLHAVYSTNSPDLIIAFGAPAASFVQQYRERLFPGTPMLFTAIEGRRIQRDKLTDNDTVVATHNDFAAAFESLLHVLPDTKTIVIVNGVSDNEKFWEGELRRELAQFSNRVELKWFTDLSFEVILKNTVRLPPHTAIFWHLMNVDAAGVTHEQNAALNRLTSSANAPTFSFLDVFFGEGLLGGSMQSVKEGSELAAAVALRVLGGEKAGDIKTPPTENALPKYDWRQLQRWSISESRLPSGSKIYFRGPTLWEQYRWQIMLIASVILIQSALIAGLLYEHRRRRLAEVLSLQRMAELAHLNRIATAGELSASIAHEVKQPVTAMVALSDAGQRWLSQQTPNLAEVKSVLEKISVAGDRAGQIVDNLRKMFRREADGRKPVSVNTVVQNVLALTNHELLKNDISVQKSLSESVPNVLGDQAQLEQVVLNLVVNAMEAMVSSDSSTRALRIETNASEADGVLITISDSGPGLDAKSLDKIFDAFYTTKQAGMGMGLSICRSIVESHGGRLWATSANRGLTFFVSLPAIHA